MTIGLTKYDALLAELEPYTPARQTLIKALFDAGVIDYDKEYQIEDKQSVAIAAIHVLKKLIVLTSDSLSKASQVYNVDMLQKRIASLCKDNGLDTSEFVNPSSITDGSNMW